LFVLPVSPVYIARARATRRKSSTPWVARRAGGRPDGRAGRAGHVLPWTPDICTLGQAGAITRPLGSPAPRDYIIRNRGGFLRARGPSGWLSDFCDRDGLNCGACTTDHPPDRQADRPIGRLLKPPVGVPGARLTVNLIEGDGQTIDEWRRRR